MEWSLPGAEPPAAVLDKGAEMTGARQPAAGESPHGETGPGSPGSIGAFVDRAGIPLLAAGLGAAQLAWITLLAYGTYWVAVWLPF